MQLSGPSRFFTSRVGSLDRLERENKTGFDTGMCWATSSLIYLTKLSTQASMSLQFVLTLDSRFSSLAPKDSVTLSALISGAWGYRGYIGRKQK